MDSSPSRHQLVPPLQTPHSPQEPADVHYHRLRRHSRLVAAGCLGMIGPAGQAPLCPIPLVMVVGVEGRAPLRLDCGQGDQGDTESCCDRVHGSVR